MQVFKRMLQTLWAAALDFAYPPHCLLCRVPLAEGMSGLCNTCWASLAVIEGSRCWRCGCPGEAGSCENCADKQFVFSRMIALVPFHKSTQKLIHMLKYQEYTSVGRLLGGALAEVLEGDALVADEPVVVPVPLHSSRLRDRGYNQSALIARVLSRRLMLPLQEGVLQRVRQTETQTALDVSSRRLNVDGAFRARRVERVLDRPVLLVDDVVTTGSTANACAEALLAAGANEVRVVAAACPYFVAGSEAGEVLSAEDEIFL